MVSRLFAAMGRNVTGLVTTTRDEVAHGCLLFPYAHAVMRGGCNGGWSAEFGMGRSLVQGGRRLAKLVPRGSPVSFRDAGRLL
jgi:hypothetical protein